MKMSVIFGVTHMTIGVILKGMNALYFNQMLDFFFEFVPQVSLLETKLRTKAKVKEMGD